jgi:hypothetical protein
MHVCEYMGIYTYCLYFSRSPLPFSSSTAVLHIVAGVVMGIAFLHEHWFIPPVPPHYAQYCPAAIREMCSNEPQRDFTLLETTYTTMAVGLLSAIIGCRTFGMYLLVKSIHVFPLHIYTYNLFVQLSIYILSSHLLGPELLNFYREASSGSSISAYFIGKAIADLPGLVVYSLMYTSTFVTMAAPNADFARYFASVLVYQVVSRPISRALLLPTHHALLYYYYYYSKVRAVHPVTPLVGFIFDRVCM